MKTKIIFCFVLILLVCFPVGVHQVSFANSTKVCWPDDTVFLEKMETLLERTPETRYGDILLRSIEVGTRYREGDVVYFVRSGMARWMQLEEWRMRDDRVYQLTTWLCTPRYAEMWSLALSPDGQLMDDNYIFQRDLEITSPEAIEKSKKIQKILRDAFPGP